MASAVVSSELQSALAGYSIFGKLWPQFLVRGGERQKVGLEIELIGSHTPDLFHIDPACPICIRLRSLLIAIARRTISTLRSRSLPVRCSVDSHTNSILCLPALGNRAFVSVSLNVFWSDKAESSLEADVLSEINGCLSDFGVRPER